MKSDGKLHRTILPILDVRRVSYTTYDAKDPDTKYPPIRICGHRRERRMY